MTQDPVISNLRHEHRDCCLTDSYQEYNCRLDVRGLDGASLTTLHGSSYQLNHAWQGRLCDRILFGQHNGSFVCAVELKGGRNIIMSDAINQIQRGLDLAASLLPPRAAEKWYPLLLYSGSMSGRERNLIRSKTVSYRGKSVRVDRIDCGSSLLDYLNGQKRNQQL